MANDNSINEMNNLNNYIVEHSKINLFCRGDGYNNKIPYNQVKVKLMRNQEDD